MGQLPETIIIDITLLSQPIVDFSFANILDNLSIWSMQKANLAICIHLIKRTKCNVWLCSYKINWRRNYDIYKRRHEHLCVCAFGPYQYVSYSVACLIIICHRIFPSIDIFLLSSHPPSPMSPFSTPPFWKYGYLSIVAKLCR